MPMSDINQSQSQSQARTEARVEVVPAAGVVRPLRLPLLSDAHKIRSGLRCTDREAFNLLFNLAVFLLFYMLGVYLVLVLQIDEA